TCSAYAQEAIEVHGIPRGALLASWRILRCNPLCKSGHDPVPRPRGHSDPPTDPRS
ncbi:MAG: membrane protein insertion efficiency factor YidD, partial [Planctomycetota bacterium]|nr:membrane protein insertion efficiency factor YidD [Planctomycetota bacterium]